MVHLEPLCSCFKISLHQVITLQIVGSYKPDDLFFFFSRVGLTHTLLTFQVTWTRAEHWIGRRARSRASIA